MFTYLRPSIGRWAVPVLMSLFSASVLAENCTDQPMSGRLYTLVNAGSGLAMDVAGGSTANGANVLQWTPNGGDNQTFTLRDLGNGYWSIRPSHSGRSLDVWEWSTKDGGTIKQWDYHGGNIQQWQLKQTDAGSFEIISRHSGKAVTVAGGQRGSDVYQQTGSGSTYQRWYLNPKDGACTSMSTPKLAASSSACTQGSAGAQWGGSCPAASRPQCVEGTWKALPSSFADSAESLRMESEHFALYWRDGTNLSAANAQKLAGKLETLWKAYYGAPMNFPELHCNTSTKWKVSVRIGNDYPLQGGSPGMQIGPRTVEDDWGLAHEFAHVVQAGTGVSRACGGIACWIFESHANWMAHQLYPDNPHCSEMQANMPHLYYGNTRTRYCNWQFFEFVKDKYCPSLVTDMWTYEALGGLDDPWQKLMTSQGWDIEALNDVFGDWAMHNVTWDYQSPDGSNKSAFLQEKYGPINADPGEFTERRLRLTQLESLDGDWKNNHRFVSPYHWAPQRWGYNVVRLYPEAGASSVKVSFRGVKQPEALPGWRWGIVATDSTLQHTRYSELQRGADGELDFCFQEGEELYLVILAAPTEYQKLVWNNPADGHPYPSIYRYPYMIELQGAWPQGFRDGERDACPEGTQRHANGGGCALAGVPDSVYVGPYAKVLGGNVTGNARIEDHATVIDGNVSGGTVGGLSLIGVASHDSHQRATFDVSGDAKVRTTFYPLGWFNPNASVSGSAQLLGDVELWSANKSGNTFYGLVDDDWNGEASVEEVTVKPPYAWRP